MKGGKIITNYILIRKIGEGSYGEVFEAEDFNKRKFAAKQISKAKFRNNKEKIDQEINILQKLNHPNIIGFSGVESTKNNIYIILEYANGGDLFDYLNFYRNTYGVTLPEQTALFLLRQITLGLQYLHSNYITHRDIKLENILLHNPNIRGKANFHNVDIHDFIIKIADFGYAKETKEQDLMKTFCGTPQCMAPEIVKNYENYKYNNEKGTYSSKIDLWSLGVVTYELLFGFPPFNSNNVEELNNRIKKGIYNIPNNLKISNNAISFLKGLLQVDAALRFTWDEINNHPFLNSKEKGNRKVFEDNVEIIYKDNVKVIKETCNDLIRNLNSNVKKDGSISSDEWENISLDPIIFLETDATQTKETNEIKETKEIKEVKASIKFKEIKEIKGTNVIKETKTIDSEVTVFSKMEIKEKFMLEI